MPSGTCLLSVGKLLRDGLDDGDLLAVLAHPLELDAAVLQSEQRVVLADAHVGAGMDMGAALPDQDVAGQNELTVAPLDAQALGHGVTAVPGGTDALLMREELKSNMKHGYTSITMMFSGYSS